MIDSRDVHESGFEGTSEPYGYNVIECVESDGDLLLRLIPSK